MIGNGGNDSALTTLINTPDTGFTSIGIRLIPNTPVVSLGTSTSLVCSADSDKELTDNPITATLDWNTTALAANLSIQELELSSFNNAIDGKLSLANVDSGYCGSYTCIVDDIDKAQVSTTTNIHVGKSNLSSLNPQTWYILC